MGFGDSFNTALGIKSQLIRSQAGLADANAVNALADAAFTARKPDLAADRNAVDWGLGQMHAGVGMAQVDAEKYGIDQRHKLGMSELGLGYKNLALQSSAIDRDASIFKLIADKQAAAAGAPAVATTPTPLSTLAVKPPVVGTARAPTTQRPAGLVNPLTRLGDAVSGVRNWWSNY